MQRLLSELETMLQTWGVNACDFRFEVVMLPQHQAWLAAKAAISWFR